ncbi:MAG: hypothetical protein PWP23_2257 [Candidatus Sumerlaeota bacterium]|nr:hypothetical protein [Candidatus Sumerlaeota bacterium]
MMEQHLAPYLPPQAGSFFWAHRGGARLPRNADGSLLLPDVCLDLREGRGDQYDFVLTGRGSTITGTATPKPCTEANAKRRDRKARMQGAVEKKRRSRRHLVHVEWKFDPDAEIPMEEEHIPGGITRTHYHLRFRDTGSWHGLPSAETLRTAQTGPPEETVLIIDIDEDEARHIEGATFEVSRGEIEWILTKFSPANIRQAFEMAWITEDNEKLSAVFDRFVHRHERLIRDHATGRRYTPVEVWEDRDSLSQGRTDRPIKHRTPKVTAALREALSAINLDHWYRCLFVTAAPPPDVNDVQFLRDAEEILKRLALGPEPFYWLRSTETRAWRPKGPYDRPAPLRLHDHTLLTSWRDIRPEERDDWANSIEGQLIVEMKRNYPSMSSRAIHVQRVHNRRHMSRLVRGQKGGPPYMCKDVDYPGRAIGRRWWNDGNEDPGLAASFGEELVLNQVQVSGDRWRVQVDQNTFQRVRQSILEYLDRPTPAHAVQFAFYALERPTIFGVLVDAGVDVSAVPQSWRFRRSVILDFIPASLGTWRARSP